RIRAARRCPHPGPPVHLQHRETGNPVIMRRGCERWDCSVCGLYLRCRDLEAMAYHFGAAESRGLQLYTALVYESQWKSFYYKMRRRKVSAYAAYHDRDCDGAPCLVVVLAGPPDAALGMKETATLAIGSMRAAFAEWQGAGSPIFSHSDTW